MGGDECGGEKISIGTGDGEVKYTFILRRIVVLSSLQNNIKAKVAYVAGVQGGAMESFG